MGKVYIINGSIEELENKDAVDKKRPFIGLRWILVIIFFFTNFVMYFARNSCAVALVVMVNSANDETEFNGTGVCPLALNKSEETSDLADSVGEFDWSPSEQGIILSAFFWGIIISKVFGSRFVEVFGQRFYVATAISIGGILQLVSPLASKLHPLALAAVTFFQGSCYGPVTSAIFSLLSVWAPSHELASMTSTTIAGGMVGIMTGIGLSGWLAEYVGWRSVFWLGAAVTFTVLPFWIFLVRNSPKEHPWLSAYEAKILQSREHIKVQKTVPWLQILKCPFLYICMLSLFARSWTEVLFTSGGPEFLSNTIGLSVSKAGLVGSIRSLCGLVMMLIYGRITDFLVKRNHVRKRNARKIFNFIGAGGMAIMLIAIASAGCNYPAVIAFWIVDGAVSSAFTLSFSLSVIDFAPNYAGTVAGLCGVGNLGSALVPLITAAMVQQTKSWNPSFFLSSGISAISCVFFVLFMTDKPQSWNFQKGDKDSP